MAEGTRTPDHRDHNPGLYQLSYRHLAASIVAATLSERPRRLPPARHPIGVASDVVAAAAGQHYRKRKFVAIERKTVACFSATASMSNLSA